MPFKSVYYVRITRKKAKRIGHILHRNCLLKHVIQGKREGRLEVTRRQRRRHKKLLDDFNEKENTGNWKRKH